MVSDNIAAVGDISRMNTFADGSVAICFNPLTLRRQPMAAESAVAQIPDLARLEKINPRSIRHISVFSRYATGMEGIRDAVNP